MMNWELSDLQRYCASKIEESLLEAIAAAFADPEEAGMRLAAADPGAYSVTLPLTASGALAHLMPQAVIDGSDEASEWRYRVDFLLICGVRPAYRKCFAIECDGHEWHEKTKQQVARDKLRDRRMILDGIVPIRFSGSEIHRDAKGCAEYIRQLAHSALGDVLAEQHMANKPSPAGKAKKRRGKA